MGILKHLKGRNPSKKANLFGYVGHANQANGAALFVGNHLYVFNTSIEKFHQRYVFNRPPLKDLK